MRPKHTSASESSVSHCSLSGYALYRRLTPCARAPPRFERRCSACDALRSCLSARCPITRRDPDTRSFVLVPSGTQSGYCFVEKQPWRCDQVPDNTSSSGFSFRVSNWDCVEPKDCPVPPLRVTDDYYNGPRVAYGFAIAAAVILMLCCGLAFASYCIAGKNALQGKRRGPRPREEAYAADRPPVPAEYGESSGAAQPAKKKKGFFGRG